MRKIQKHSPSCQCQRGIAMIEALISVILLAIGILGLIAFQAEMTKNATQAKLRGEAAFLANQLIGQMWAADQATLPTYTVVEGACQLANNACANWANTVASTLPSGEANVNVNVAQSLVNITLSWTLPGEAASRYQIDAHILN